MDFLKAIFHALPYQLCFRHQFQGFAEFVIVILVFVQMSRCRRPIAVDSVHTGGLCQLSAEHGSNARTRRVLLVLLRTDRVFL